MIRNKLFSLFLFMLILCSGLAISQPYGNEWIVQGQRYFKININENGLYRLTRAELAGFGFPVSSVDPRKIQVFHLGQQISIHIEGQLDGVFDTSDYIEFYAEASDGSTDTLLYIEPGVQPHGHYNLFSDSSAYFFTYKLNLETGNRMDDFFENNSGSIPADNYFIDDNLEVYTTVYYQGRSYDPSNAILLPIYDFGEGWTGNFASQGRNIDKSITGLTNSIQDDINPTINVLLIGGNNNGHNVTISAGQNASALRTLTTVNFTADEIYLVSEQILWSDISASGNMVIRASINGVGGSADRVSVSYANVTYSKNFDVNNELSSTFRLKTNTGNKSYLEVTNTPSNVQVYDITSPNDPLQIGVNASVGKYSAVVPNTATQRILYAQSGTKTISNFEEISFNHFNPSSFDYLLISHKDLRGTTTSGQGDQVTAYKNYRETVAGGSHTVLEMNIDQVFNQFNYGNPSPLAIRKFCEYIYDNGSPTFLFLIGKASNIQAGYYRDNPNTTSTKHFVPTFGYPGGDVPFSTGFDGGKAYPTLATGRINATNPNDIEAYLNKVIEEEALPFDNLRRKNLVHLSGGSSEAELNLFKAYIKSFSDIADGILLGGESAQISKNNNGAVELINISDELNKGTMMVTFFGHSSGSVTDLEIGLVSDPSSGYSNKGNYPVFLINGCLAGDFFSNQESFGVDWILTPNLGALAFIAHSHTGLSNKLHTFTNLFYKVAFTDSEFISKSIGEIKRETSKRFELNYGASEINIAQIQLENLQGDPAVKIFGPDKPDFDINENYLQSGTFDGTELLATVDSFYLELNVRNFGIYSSDNFYIGVKRTFANGKTKDYGPFLYDQILREDTIKITIDNDVSSPEGLNSFTITLDPLDLIEEMDKTNNTASIDIFLSSGSTINLIPSDHSIQNKATLPFYYQSSNLLVGNRRFDIEIDTVISFDSPFKIAQSTVSTVIGKIDINLESKNTIPDGTVFYWRTKFSESLPTEGDEWATTSFILDKSLGEGWSQSSPNQLGNSNLEGIEIDLNNGNWGFVTTNVKLEVDVFGSNHPSSNYQDAHVLLNGRNYFVTNSNLDAGCRDNTINFMAFKRQSVVPFQPIDLPGADVLNPLICGLLPQSIYNYRSPDIAGLYSPEAFIDNLKPGDNVLIFSLGTVNYSSWSTAFKDKLGELGIGRALLDTLSDDKPIILLGAKVGAKGSASPPIHIQLGATPLNTQQLSLKTDLMGAFDSGIIESSIIGPAKSWTQVTAEVESINPLDQKKFTVIGLDQFKNETPLFPPPSMAITELTNFDLSSVNADLYPFMKLRLEIFNNISLTPNQLQSWNISYETTPEGILLMSDTQGFDQPIEIQEGQEKLVSYTFWNFSEKDFQDSVKIRYELINQEFNRNVLDSLNISALNAGDSTQFELHFQSLGNVGISDLILNVNDNYPFEVYAFNNAARVSNYLSILSDDSNPIVDVSFDGIQIMDGDIVSPTPNIEVLVHDENEFIFIEDTTGMNMYIRYPCEDCEFERIAFSSVNTDWTPASNGESFKVIFSPEKLEDGRYGFRVQAADASGNVSGIKPFEINFEVINASTITNFYPYPNPFSSSTRFIFTLTGSVLPEDIKIQILTISGRVAREIFMDELGPINIGNNKSDYAWDGRDNYGDQLANGVYLYRVLLKNPGKNFQHRMTSADKGFKNGFGKMYLLR